MGTANITTRNDGDIIPVTDHNELVNALQVNVVPRNSSGVATDIAGTLGTAIYRWLTGYFQKLIIGVAANLVSIEESSSSLLFKFNGVLGAQVSVAGFDGAYMKLGSIPNTAMAAGFNFLSNFSAGTYTKVVPAGVTIMYAFAAGGGGGGGGGAGQSADRSGGGGGGGGAGVQPVCIPFAVTPGETITMVVGSGGASGAAGGVTSNGGAGGAGGFTSVTRSSNGLTLTFSGGDAGAGGVAGAAGGGGGGTGWAPTRQQCGGGAGGAAGASFADAASGGAGVTGMYATGGAGGLNYHDGQGEGHGGGGGGGGPGLLGGGAGGHGAGIDNTLGTGGTGGSISAGGGGGGGGSNDLSNAPGFAGGAGGAGYCALIWAGSST